MSIMYFEDPSKDLIRCQLNRVYYPVTTLGYGQRLGFWFQGCSRGCKGCISPEMQPSLSFSVPLRDVLSSIPKDISPDGLTISGGEPFQQPSAVRALVEWFLSTYGDDILVYTGYSLSDLYNTQNKDILWILSHISVLVDGPYIQEFDDGIGARGSSNQCIHIFNHADRYEHFSSQQRMIQCIREQNQLFLIGIPLNSRGE